MRLHAASVVGYDEVGSFVTMDSSLLECHRQGLATLAAFPLPTGKHSAALASSQVAVTN